MADHPPVLVAPDAFGPELRAPAVAAAIARGLERAGVTPLPELCPVSGGGTGTIEVLLPALGGETRDGYALIEDGGTAIVELAPTAELTAKCLVAASRSGADVLVLAAAGGPLRPVAVDDEALLAAVAEHGGLTAAFIVLCDARAPGALAERLRDAAGARLVAGVGFVLDALGFDGRMRGARALVVGDGRLERGTLQRRVTGEIATRARQIGVPCHAVAGIDAIDRFDARILDLQAIIEASSIAALEAAGEALADYL